MTCAIKIALNPDSTSPQSQSSFAFRDNNNRYDSATGRGPRGAENRVCIHYDAYIVAVME